MRLFCGCWDCAVTVTVIMTLILPVILTAILIAILTVLRLRRPRSATGWSSRSARRSSRCSASSAVIFGALLNTSPPRPPPSPSLHARLHAHAKCVCSPRLALIPKPPYCRWWFSPAAAIGGNRREILELEAQVETVTIVQCLDPVPFLSSPTSISSRLRTPGASIPILLLSPPALSCHVLLCLAGLTLIRSHASVPGTTTTQHQHQQQTRPRRQPRSTCPRSSSFHPCRAPPRPIPDPAHHPAHAYGPFDLPPLGLLRCPLARSCFNSDFTRVQSSLPRELSLSHTLTISLLI